MKLRGLAVIGTVCRTLLVVFLACGYAMADEVILKNGDRLTGKVTEVKDGVLTLETSYSEPIKLQFEAVEKMIQLVLSSVLKFCEVPQLIFLEQ